MVEAKCPGAVEHYVNLDSCYDSVALSPLRQELMACTADYKNCYRRAYRCLSAAAQIAEDLRSTLLTPALEAKMQKRAAGILSREVRRSKKQLPGRVTQRFLSAITHAGPQFLFETTKLQCPRIYELADNYGLAHTMLSHLLAGFTAAGYDVVACPSPMAPERLEHLLIPSLELAFLTSGSDYQDLFDGLPASCQNGPIAAFVWMPCQRQNCCATTAPDCVSPKRFPPLSWMKP